MSARPAPRAHHDGTAASTGGKAHHDPLFPGGRLVRRVRRRPASRTAVLVCQGRAVADGRLAPGRFHDPTATALLRDEERVPVDQVRAGAPPQGWGPRVEFEMVRAASEVMVARTVAIDEAMRSRLSPQVARQPRPWAAEPRRSSWTAAAMRALLTSHRFPVAADNDLFTVAAGLPVEVKQHRSLRSGRIAVADRPR